MCMLRNAFSCSCPYGRSCLLARVMAPPGCHKEEAAGFQTQIRMEAIKCEEVERVHWRGSSEEPAHSGEIKVAEIYIIKYALRHGDVFVV